MQNLHSPTTGTPVDPGTGETRVWRWPRFPWIATLVAAAAATLSWLVIPWREEPPFVEYVVVIAFIVFLDWVVLGTALLNRGFVRHWVVYGSKTGDAARVMPPWKRRLLDGWFLAFPVVIALLYWWVFAIFGGRPFVSTDFPEGHPWHISWGEGWLFMGIALAIMASWLVTFAMTCIMLARRATKPVNLLTQIVFLFAAPIACPVCYFTRLRRGIRR